jgi:hypothetical protein
MSPLSWSLLCLAILSVTITAQQEGCLAPSFRSNAQAYNNCCPQADNQQVTISGKTLTLHCGKLVDLNPSSANSPKECANNCSKDASCIGSYWAEVGACYTYKLNPDPNNDPSLAMVPWDDASNNALANCTGSLNTCTGNLNTCTGNLNTCTASQTSNTCAADLNTCTGNLNTCTGNLNTCTKDLTTRTGELTQCNGDLAECRKNLGKADPSCPAKLAKCTKDLANAKTRKGALKNPIEATARKACGKPYKQWTKRAHTFAAWRKCTIQGLKVDNSIWIKNDPEECAKWCSDNFDCTSALKEPYDGKWVCRLFMQSISKPKKDNQRDVILRLD